MIRKFKNNDRDQIELLINEINQFTSDEKEVALELVDEVINDADQKYYNIFVYEENKKIVGYHCTGKRALTKGVYDLYWIVVKPDQQTKGVGKELLDHVEEFVESKNGRWILVETSSKEEYEKTRSFYLRNFYSVIAEIKDFYSEGDNLIIFGKYLKI